MNTTTRTPTPSRRPGVRRGTALAVATLLAAGTGSAILSAPSASAAAQFSGCNFAVSKVDPAGNPLPGASFRVATTDGSAKLLTAQNSVSVGQRFAALVKPFAVAASGPALGTGTNFIFTRDSGGAIPSMTLADVRASLATLLPSDQAAQANPIPSSAAAGFDTTPIATFQAAVHAQVLAEQAFLAANGGVQDLTLAPAVLPPGTAGTGFANLLFGLQPPPASNPPGVVPPQVLNPVFGAPGAGRDTRLAHEVGVPFTVQLSSQAGTTLVLPAGLNFVSADAGATFNAATRTVTAPAGLSNVVLVGTTPGNPVLQAVSGQSRSGTLTLAIQTPVSSIAPAPAVDLINNRNPALAGAVAASRDITNQVNLPTGLAGQLATIKAPVEVSSLTITAPGGGSIAGLSPAVLAGITGGAPNATASAPGPLTVVAVDSGPANSGVGIPLSITEVTAPNGFVLDPGRPQALTVGFDSCLGAPPAPSSPAWTVTSTASGTGRVVTATLRDTALAAVVTPPVVTPPVVTTPPPVVVVPPVPVTPPVAVPVAPVPVTPPVAVTPVSPAPVATPAPVVPTPVAAPAPAATAVPVAPAPQAPQVTRVAVPRGVDAGLGPAAGDTSSSTNTGGILGAVLAALGLSGVAGGLIARRRRS